MAKNLYGGEDSTPRSDLASKKMELARLEEEAAREREERAQTMANNQVCLQFTKIQMFVAAQQS